jgi:hypothetical protein
MTDQDPGAARPSSQPSAVGAATAKERPESNDPAATDSTLGERNQPRTYRIELHTVDRKSPPGWWQKTRENIKDLVIPVATVVFTFVTFYVGQRYKENVDKQARADATSNLMGILSKDLSGKPRDRDLAVIKLVGQGEDALPALYIALETDDYDMQQTACEVLKKMIIGGVAAVRQQVLGRMSNDLEGGDRVAFRGFAYCFVSSKKLLTDQETKLQLGAIETRMGPDARLCRSQAIGAQREVDNNGAIEAVIAEYNFPLATGHAPDFLAGVVCNCREPDFSGAREAAINNLPAVLQAAYPQDCAKRLADTLKELRDGASSEARVQIDQLSPGLSCQ